MKQNVEHGKKRGATRSISFILALVFVFSIFSGMVAAECFKVTINAELSCDKTTNCGPCGNWVRGPGISLVWTKARLCDDLTQCDGSADICTKCCCRNLGLCTVDRKKKTKVTHTSHTHISRWEYDFSFGFSKPTRQCEPIEYVWSEKDQVVDSDGYEIVEAELSSHIYSLYSLTHPVTVDSTISNAAFIVHWVGSDLNLVLYTPSGMLVDPSVAKIDPDVYFEEAKNYEFYDIRRQKPGNWTMKVIAVDVPDVGEDYTVRAFLMSNLTFTLSTDKYRYNSNEQVRIVANLRYNNTPLIGKTVTATIQRPDGIIDTAQLFDDGSHGDIKADDGKYSNIYTNTILAGTYHIIASTSGTTPDNGFFFREKRKSIIVQALKAEFNDIYSDYGADTDDDGLYDCLTINVGVNIINPGNYSIKGQLSDKDGYEIVLADNAAYFDIGNNLLQLNFDGLQIRRHGGDAPFKLRYLVLSNATGTLIDYRYDAYATSAYNYIDFQAPAVEFTDDYADYGTDIDGDGLYDYLTIDVGVNVIIAGNYSLTGWLYDANGRKIVWAVNDTYLSAENNLVLLNFDGFQICRHGVNAPFKLGYLALSDVTGSLIDYGYDASTTLAYTYSEFQTPTIEFSRDYSHYGTDTDGDGLYDYLTVDAGVKQL